MKYYRQNLLVVWDTDILYPLGEQFGVFLQGDLDGLHDFHDFLCLVYPRDSDGSCDCNQPPTPPGEVIVFYNDITNRFCWQ